MGAFSHANPCAGINLGVDDDDDDVSLAQLRDQLFSRGGAASVAGANVTAPGVNATDPGDALERLKQDERERCAKWHDKQEQMWATYAHAFEQGGKHEAVDQADNNAMLHRDSAAAIRLAILRAKEHTDD